MSQTENKTWKSRKKKVDRVLTLISLGMLTATVILDERDRRKRGTEPLPTDVPDETKEEIREEMQKEQEERLEEEFRNQGDEPAGA